MRDVNRIPVIMSLLTEIWQKQPDVRFNQLISNLQWEYSDKNNGAGKETVYIKEDIDSSTIYESHHSIDLFYLEDDKFILFLEDKLREEDSNE